MQGGEASYCQVQPRSLPLLRMFLCLWQIIGFSVVQCTLPLPCDTWSTFPCPSLPCRLHSLICWAAFLLYQSPDLQLRQPSVFSICKRVAEVQGNCCSVNNKSIPLGQTVGYPHCQMLPVIHYVSESTCIFWKLSCDMKSKNQHESLKKRRQIGVAITRTSSDLISVFLLIMKYNEVLKQ